MKLLIMFVKHCSPIQQIFVDIFIQYLGAGISEVQGNLDGIAWCSADMHLQPHLDIPTLSDTWKESHLQPNLTHVISREEQQ